MIILLIVIQFFSHPLQSLLFDGPLLFIYENIGSELYSMLYIDNFIYIFFSNVFLLLYHFNFRR